jgi:hypothetical protein
MIELEKHEDGFWLYVEGATKKALIKIHSECGFCWVAMEEHAQRSEVLFRRFSPVSTYEPDAKREEWKGAKDCWPCPWLGYRKIPKLVNPQYGIYSVLKCKLNTEDVLPLGDPSFCRFTKYRRIVFRNFTGEHS